MKNIKRLLRTGVKSIALAMLFANLIGCGGTIEEQDVALPAVSDIPEEQAVALPEISDTARKHFDRGMAAVEVAADLEDYEGAITEFEKAVELAPEWRSALYNLAIVQDKGKQYEDAMVNLNSLIASVSSEDERIEIQSIINKVEYKMEKAQEAQYEYFKPVVVEAVAVEENRGPIVIPEINAWLDTLKFYKEKADYGARSYTKYFDKRYTGYVRGELMLKHPENPWTRTNFDLEIVYIKPNGDVLGRFVHNTYAKDGWQRSYHTFSWGWDTLGYWVTGWHQVEVYYKGNLIASEQFSVY